MGEIALPPYALVGRVACGVRADAHHAKYALRIKDCCAIGLKLVADGAELVKRTANLVLVMYDHLKAAAFRVNDAKTVLAEEVSGIGRAGGLVGVAGGLENRCEAVLNEADTMQLTNLAVEDLTRSGILVCLNPLVG